MPCRMKTIPTVMRKRLSRYGDSFAAVLLDEVSISSPVRMPVCQYQNECRNNCQGTRCLTSRRARGIESKSHSRKPASKEEVSMRHPGVALIEILAVLVAMMLLTPVLVAGQAPKTAVKTFTPPKTPWGHPD